MCRTLTIVLGAMRTSCSFSIKPCFTVTPITALRFISGLLSLSDLPITLSMFIKAGPVLGKCRVPANRHFFCALGYSNLQRRYNYLEAVWNSFFANKVSILITKWIVWAQKTEKTLPEQFEWWAWRYLKPHLPESLVGKPRQLSLRQVVKSHPLCLEDRQSMASVATRVSWLDGRLLLFLPLVVWWRLGSSS